MINKSIHNQLPSFLANRETQIRNLCEKHKVRYLYAIGSVLRPQDFNENSDVDLVFAFREDEINDRDYNPNLWSLWKSLENLFERKIDLIHGPSLKNPYFIEEVNDTKKLIYGEESEKISLGRHS